MEYSTSHLYFLRILSKCVYQENTIEKLNILWYMYIMRKHSITTRILYLATEGGQPNQCNLCTAHSGKVGCNTIEYDKGFLYSVNLYFLWHDIKYSIVNSYHHYNLWLYERYKKIINTVLVCIPNVYCELDKHL